MFRALFFVLSALLLIVIAHAEEEESTDVNKKKEELATLRKKAETGGAADWFSLAAALIEEEQHDESRTWLRRASEKGHVESAFLLGEIYREGRSVTADEVEALRLIRFAAEKGLPRAMGCYGLLLYFGNGVRPDKEKAAEWLRKGADSGDVFCMFMFSRLRKDSDHAMSFKYSLMGAQHDNEHCMAIVAKHYAEGTGVKADPIEAGIWAHIAKQKNDELRYEAVQVLDRIGPAHAISSLTCVQARIARHGIEISQDRRSELKEEQDEFLELARKATRGDKDAAVDYAVRLITGLGCVPDLKEGAKRLLNLAEADSAKACLEIADLHLTGQGFPKDSAQASRWYAKAYQKGNAEAAMNMAIGLSNGWFGDKNEPEAERWLKLSADAGHGPAQLRLAEKHLYEENYAEMLRWYRKAAQNGEQSALVGLFQAHLRGRGVRINVGEAAGYALATMRVGTIKDEDEEREVLRFVMRMDEKYEAAAEAACERIINHEFAISNR